MTHTGRCTAAARVAVVVVALVGCAADGDDSMRSIAAGGAAAAGSVPPVVVTEAPGDSTPQDTTVYPSTGEVADVLSIDNNFLPQVVEITAGTAVHWANNGRNDHDITAADDGKIGRAHV